MNVNDNLRRMAAVCKTAGFAKRGSAFFRVSGEGVLQVLKYSEKEQPFHVEIIKIGLFSLYSELKPQWLTSSGCIPLYNYCYLATPRWELERPYREAGTKTLSLTENVFSFSFHLDYLIDSTIPFLDEIDSQKKLLQGIDHLEYISKLNRPASKEEAIRWTDMNKYCPFLYEHQYTDAERVIQAFLDVYEKNAAKQEASAFDLAQEKELKAKAALAKCGDVAKIEAYLQENYQRNKELVAFCTGKNRCA